MSNLYSQSTIILVVQTDHQRLNMQVAGSCEEHKHQAENKELWGVSVEGFPEERPRKKGGGTIGTEMAEVLNKEACEGWADRWWVGRDQILQNSVADGKISDFIASNGEALQESRYFTL